MTREELEGRWAALPADIQRDYAELLEIGERYKDACVAAAVAEAVRETFAKVNEPHGPTTPSGKHLPERCWACQAAIGERARKGNERLREALIECRRESGTHTVLDRNRLPRSGEGLGYVFLVADRALAREEDR